MDNVLQVNKKVYHLAFWIYIYISRDTWKGRAGTPLESSSTAQDSLKLNLFPGLKLGDF